MTSRHLIMMLVSALALSVAPACGDNNDPAAENNPSENNPENNDGCGAGKIEAAYEGGASKCYVSCTSDTGCGLDVCRDADGGAGKICVTPAGGGCGTGEIEASYQGVNQCYKACANDAACGDSTKECKDADGGAAKVCVAKQGGGGGNCEPFLEYSGQIFDENEDPTYGGSFASDTSSYAEDAGIEAFNTFIKGKFDALPVDDDGKRMNFSEAFEAGSELQITEATITSTNFSGNPWFGLTVEDKKGTLVIYILNDADRPTIGPRVGDKVSFKIKSYAIFNGTTPQVSTISDFTVVSSDNPVRVIEATGEDVPAKWNQIVRLGGKLTSITNESCGGDYKCYNLKHGEAGSEKDIVFRSRSTFVEVGDCVTFVGPIGVFPIYGDSPQPQLNELNFDWTFVPN